MQLQVHSDRCFQINMTAKGAGQEARPIGMQRMQQDGWRGTH